MVSADLKSYYAERDVMSVFRGVVVRTCRYCKRRHGGRVQSTCIRSMVSDCVACSVNADNNVTRSTPCIPVSWPTEAWSKVGIDIFGKLSDVPESKRFVITLIDYHSR
jgi:hypothetical protein